MLVQVAASGRAACWCFGDGYVRAPLALSVAFPLWRGCLCLHRRAGSHRGWLPEHLSARTCQHPTQPSDHLPHCGCCCSWRRMAETQVASSAAASSERCSAPMSPDVVNRGGVALYWFRTKVVRVVASCSVCSVVAHIIPSPRQARLTSPEETVAAVHQTIE